MELDRDGGVWLLRMRAVSRSWRCESGVLACARICSMRCLVDGWAGCGSVGCCSMTSRARAGELAFSASCRRSAPGAARCSMLSCKFWPLRRKYRLESPQAWSSEDPRSA